MKKPPKKPHSPGSLDTLIHLITDYHDKPYKPERFLQKGKQIRESKAAKRVPNPQSGQNNQSTIRTTESPALKSKQPETIEIDVEAGETKPAIVKNNNNMINVSNTKQTAKIEVGSVHPPKETYNICLIQVRKREVHSRMNYKKHQ